MSTIFKLIIGLVIFGVLGYLIFNIFVFTPDDKYSDIVNSITVAIESPGNPICNNLSIKKEDYISTKLLLNNSLLVDKKIFVWFASFDNKYTIFSNFDSSTFIAKQNYSNLNYCVVCYPPILFSKSLNYKELITKNNYFCEIVFGDKLTVPNINLTNFNDNIIQGNNEIANLNVPNNYNYYLYIFDNKSKDLISENQLSILKETTDLTLEDIFNLDTVNNKYELKTAGNKLILQAIIPKNIELLKANLPAKFLMQNVIIKPNDNYLSKDCKALNSETKYVDYDKQKCVVYHYCEGCNLPSYCSDAWNYSGITVEADTIDHAISYTSIDECN